MNHGRAPLWWTLGPIEDVVGQAADPTLEAADRVAVIKELESAVPTWRLDPTTYAEHFGLLADLLYVSFNQNLPQGDLQKASTYVNDAISAPGISGLVLNRLKLMSVQIDIAKARRDGGVQAGSACL